MFLLPSVDHFSYSLFMNIGFATQNMNICIHANIKIKMLQEKLTILYVLDPILLL